MGAQETLQKAIDLADLPGDGGFGLAEIADRHRLRAAQVEILYWKGMAEAQIEEMDANEWARQRALDYWRDACG